MGRARINCMDKPAETVDASTAIDPQILLRVNQEQLQTIGQLQRELEQLRHQYQLLVNRLYGRRSEKQTGPGLFDDWLPEVPTSTTTPEPEPVVKLNPPRNATPHGRQKLAGNLPRQRIDHDLSEEQKRCPCCQTPRVRIGEEVSEQLDYRPSSLFIVEHHRFKYVCRSCEQPQHETAPMPAQPIDKGIAGPGLLAHVVTSKYADHLPLYRLEGILSRHGVDLSRSTMGGWMAATADLLTSIYNRMHQRVLVSRVIHTDDTTVPVQDDNRSKTKQGRLWVYVGDANHPLAFFDYTPTHSRAGPEQILRGFQGYLQADALPGYDQLYKDRKIREVGCWAHARRKFVEAKASAAGQVHVALGFIAELYHIETQLKEKTEAERMSARQAYALPKLREFRTWLEAQSTLALPKSPLGIAIAYSLTNMDALMRYTEAGYLNIDNNLSERTLRLIAIGRKNWIFAGSDEGAKTAAVLFSMTATCKHLKLDPFAYLRDLFTELPKINHPTEEQRDFWLPDAWAKRLPAKAE